MPFNMVIAVSPIYDARNFSSLITMEQVIAIELQDSEEHIFERLVFSDENDNVYWEYLRKMIRRETVGGRTTAKLLPRQAVIR